LHKARYISILVLSLSFLTCENSAKEKDIPNYRLNEPSIKSKLPETLDEVSGVYYSDIQNIAMVQDEIGTIFFYNLESKDISDSFSFSGKGDFEGITKVKNSYFVLRSDGTLFQVISGKSSYFNGKSYSLDLPNLDCEGICYDSSSNRLLISTKAVEDDDDDLDEIPRRIYGFNLKTKTFSKEPIISLTVKSIEKFLKKHEGDLQIRDDHKKKIKFQPSDMAIHPTNGNLYIISASGNLLCITNLNGNIKEIYFLDEDLYPKAEGISFGSDGELYITNEIDGETATLLQIKYEKLHE